MNDKGVEVLTYSSASRPGMVSFLAKQLKLIRRGGIQVFIDRMRLLLRLLPYLPAILLAFPVVLSVRLLSPLVVIRFGPIRANRIGHFAPEIEMYICELEQGIHGDRAQDLFYYEGRICNHQLAKMWSRTISVTRFARWPDILNRHIPGGGQHVIPRRTTNSPYDVHGVLENTTARLSFNPEEERSGRQALERMGIPDGTPFVCFAARDTAYMEAQYPDDDWSYHDFRNSTINNYLAAAEEMVERGHSAVRMGAVVSAKLETDCQKVIDYAANGGRSDFLDLYLAAKCRMFICSADGISNIPMVFRRPIVLVNYIPMGDLWTWSSDFLCIPKKLWLRAEGRFMTFREIFDSQVHLFIHSEQYERFGIDIVENTSEDITAVAVEMDERLQGNWKSTGEDEELQGLFWSAHKSWYPSVAKKSRIGAEFLRQNRDLLD